MKQRITITHNDTVVYDGRISDMPIKEDAIIEKSIELFDDEDPCIIHQSYVIKEYVDVVFQLLREQNPVIIKDALPTLSFLDLEDLQHCVIHLEG